MRPYLIYLLLLIIVPAFSQQKKDSVIYVEGHMITLSSVVINNKLNVPSFIQRVKNDTTFYKAFRNLHILNYTSINDIRMMDKDGGTQASLHSKTQQMRSGDCRRMRVLEESTTGDIYDRNKNFNYYTGELYAKLFFTKDSVCGEDNIVKGKEFATDGLHGMEKHKEQLKMLFFNPGRKIEGIPFIGSKTAIFDKNMADNYDMNIDLVLHNKTDCYEFRIKAKPDRKSDVVIDEMTTWFDNKTFEIIARDYTLSYNASVYDFKVQMQVEMTRVGNLLVPSLLRYVGNWKAIFKRRERGFFTATLYDFKQQ